MACGTAQTRTLFLRVILWGNSKGKSLSKPFSRGREKLSSLSQSHDPNQTRKWASEEELRLKRSLLRQVFSLKLSHHSAQEAAVPVCAFGWVGGGLCVTTYMISVLRHRPLGGIISTLLTALAGTADRLTRRQMHPPLENAAQKVLDQFSGFCSHQALRIRSSQNQTVVLQFFSFD